VSPLPMVPSRRPDIQGESTCRPTPRTSTPSSTPSARSSRPSAAPPRAPTRPSASPPGTPSPPSPRPTPAAGSPTAATHRRIMAHEDRSNLNSLRFIRVFAFVVSLHNLIQNFRFMHQQLGVYSQIASPPVRHQRLSMIVGSAMATPLPDTPFGNVPTPIDCLIGWIGSPVPEMEGAHAADGTRRA
jgi:hypothetical protein